MSRLWLLTQTLIILALGTPVVFAQYTSPNYKTNEVFFGAGGSPQATSPNYQANLSLGSLGVGNTSSTNYLAYSGFITPNEPFLEMGIDSSNVDLGTLDTTTTMTGVATFHVRAYVNSGYTIQTMSQPPTYTSGAVSHTLAPMTSQAPPATGTEQFGINLVANAGFGADPSPQPDSSFANGQASSSYGTTDQFKYNVGDIIACSGASAPCSTGKGWGLTNYTISYIANIAPLTPAGKYTMVHDLVVVATY